MKNMSTVAVAEKVAPLRDAKGHFLPKAKPEDLMVKTETKTKTKVETKVEAPKVRKVGRPRRETPAEGRRLYTTKWDKEANVMTCTKCGKTWTPKTRPESKRLLRGQWICPDGCCTK
jgi:hypothetical protein